MTLGRGRSRFWRFAGVLVRQRINRHVRKFGFDSFRHVIDKSDHGAGVRLLRRIQRAAIGAFARRSVVVLRDADDVGVGRFAQPFLDLLHDEIAQFGIGQAKLRIVVNAFPIDQTEPFRMCRKIFSDGGTSAYDV